MTPVTTPGRHRASLSTPRYSPSHALETGSWQASIFGKLAALAAAATLAVVSLVCVSNATATSAIVASDSMNRTVAAGFGSADVGGAYTVSSASLSHVANHAGVLGPVAPGRAVSAMLSKSSLKDLDVRATVQLSAKATSGSGVYFYTLLRALPNSSGYYATLRAMPDGRYALRLSIHQNGSAVDLGKQVIVPGISSATKSIVVAAQISGSASVTIQMSAWAAGATPVSSWQFEYSDKRAARMTNAGRLGFAAYLSGAAAVRASANLLGFTAWVPAAASPSTSSRVPAPPVATQSSTSSTAPSHSSAPPISTTAGSHSTTAATSSAATTRASSSTASKPTSSADVTPSGSPSSTTSQPQPPGGAPSGGSPGATLGSTGYTVPSDALFVAPTGNDSASGALQAPWRTIAHAIAAAPNHATIVMRAGTYHESVTVPGSKTLTIEAYPGEVVWLDGSTPVTNWTKSGDHWIAGGWTAQFDSTPSYTGNIPSGGYWTFVNQSHPMASHPDEFWLGDNALTQVSSADQVKPGSFYVDYSNDQIVLGQDPSGMSPRASDLGIAMTVNSPNTVLRNFGVRRYATAVDAMGSVRLGGSGDSIDNILVTASATTGISTSKPDVHVSNVTVSDNGMLGMSAVYADGLVMSSVLSKDNNAEMFNFAPVSGGVKITRSRGVIVKDSTFESNEGPGLWFDESCYNVTAVGNSFVDNAGNGMSFEISSTGIFANNVVAGNGGIGIKINDSNNAKVWNNSFSGNYNNMNIAQDSRRASNTATAGHDPRRPNPDPNVPWLISDDVAMNNVFQPTTSGAPNIYVNDYTHEYSAAQLGIDVDGNLFVRPQSGGAIIGWDGANKQLALYSSSAAFASAVGRGGSNVDVAQFAAAASAANQTVGHPLPLPADVAAATGQPVSVRHLGTFN